YRSGSKTLTSRRSPAIMFPLLPWLALRRQPLDIVRGLMIARRVVVPIASSKFPAHTAARNDLAMSCCPPVANWLGLRRQERSFALALSVAEGCRADTLPDRRAADHRRSRSPT